MQEFDNTNRGSLFKNDKKETDKQPDYKGSINIEGTDFWLSAWLQTSKNGVKYFSMSVQLKEKAKPVPPMRGTPQRAAPGHQPSRGSGFDNMDDDIPF